MVKLFADGAEVAEMWKHYQNPLIQGLTSNPSLMKKAGIADYKEWALQVLSVVKEKPISFEVLSDTFADMWRQAMEIASWGDNVYVKIPITNTNGVYNYALVETLSNAGVKVNVTAIMTPMQVADILPALEKTKGAYVSVFAGRIADTGIDPIPIMQHCLKVIEENPKVELIWASPRELLNVVQANEIGCHIITCTNDILKKLPLIGKDLLEFSKETVKMFFEDGKGLHIG